MYDKVYTYPDPDKKEKEKKGKVNFGFKDILAMTIAAYQIIFVPFAIIALTMVALFLLFKLLFGS
ncbi:hypothetical protein BBF96_10010 [Anoxybacter fermentans]|uniref:Uncharacterized protein n=1 Tax=Anoxybacter fermentans TaxID=1323375 RepID=A0A3Q9HR18_9FIRM|nr:hypothetical protein [Anoxybacter fermentans]AZR73686.1 hypothetical protein BBF96_10010 [Anoxybacter fermentans]